VNSETAKTLYRRYKDAVAYVSVESANGDQQIGSAFHLGEGIWVTARHVVESQTILEVGVDLGTFDVVGPPLLHPDESVDVALLRLSSPTPNDEIPAIELGGWLDDWLDDGLTLEPVLILGYPPIPFGREPRLVASRAEVSTVLDKRSGGHPYFILTGMARGGVSGGLAMTSQELALGVTVESLVSGPHPAELGYLAVLSVEPIYHCLEHHGVLPQVQTLPGIYEPPHPKRTTKGRETSR
jgi:hypothetical protein